MTHQTQYGLESARTRLPHIVADAHAGITTIITRHGKPMAAVVPLNSLQAAAPPHSLLSLRGSGQGLWGSNAAHTVAQLRDEWESN